MSKPDHDHVRGDACCEPPEQRQTALPATTEAGWLHVPAMDCVTEESEIRRALDRLDGIRALTFRLSERSLHIDASPAIVNEAADLLRRIGFDARPVSDRPATPETAADVQERGHAPAAQGFVLPPSSWPAPWCLAIAAEGVSYLRGRNDADEGARTGAGRERHRARRLRRLQEGYRGAAGRPTEHQRADERGGDRCRIHRPVGRSGDGDGAVRDRRIDRSAGRRTRSQCHHRADGDGAGDSDGPSGQRRVAGTAS